MPLTLGTSAPAIAGTDVVNEQPWALQNHAGKSVLLAFSGITWCGPCQKEAPALESVWQVLSGPQFTMAIISGQFISDESLTSLQTAIAQFGISFPVVPGNSHWPAYEITGVPTLYCLTWNATKSRHEVGGVLTGASGSTDEIAAEILDFLADCGVTRSAKVSDAGKWAAVFAQIFGGVTSDGGGWGLRPGGKPVPIDPWDPLRALGSAGRDVLVGLAVAEMAGQLRNAALRKRVRQAGLSAAQTSLRRLDEPVAGGAPTTLDGPTWGPAQARRSSS